MSALPSAQPSQDDGCGYAAHDCPRRLDVLEALTCRPRNRGELVAGSAGVTPAYMDLESMLIFPIDPPRMLYSSPSRR